ncbi:MAG: recombinase family protein [Clostridiales Family XIII bacterium]|jgi:hypothetical protein|nr:recombinase family protein [Clostridiales Family XIII bacterium]
MKMQRSIPFGYTVEMGVIVTDAGEAAAVREAFQRYRDGASYLNIAGSFSARGIAFLPGRTDWNKNRIKRILEDIRYTGTNDYPQIIEEEVFAAAEGIRLSKPSHTHGSANKDAAAVTKTVCGVCGAEMKRVHDKRRKTQESRICNNKGCGVIVRISDDTLRSDATALLNSLIRNPHRIEISPVPTEAELYENSPYVSEIRKLQAEMGRLEDCVNEVGDKPAELAHALARLRYRGLGNERYMAELIKAEFEKSNPLFTFNRKLFDQTVSALMLMPDAAVSLVLKNGQTIGRKDADDARISDAGNNSGEKHHAHTA